jgi:hypothetical protein
MFESGNALCMTLLCPRAIEEKLLDLLLMSPNMTVFTSTATSAHGLAHVALGQTEQVLGRAHATEIQVIFTAADQAALLEVLRQQFAGAGLRYWVTPVIEAGEIA